MAVSVPPEVLALDNSSEHLLFAQQGSLYAVKVRAVNAIVWLPALTPLDETPRCQIGVFNLRGRIVPVIDCAIRLGHAPSPYRLMDCVIVLEVGARLLGVIANEVLDVLAVRPLDAQAFQDDSGDDSRSTLVRAGQVVGDGRIVMCLDPEMLLRGDGVEGDGAQAPAEIAPETASRFCLGDGEEAGIFIERARRLMPGQDGDEAGRRLGLAVVRLGKEFFGVALEKVREFAETGEVVPVPCAPAHIVGSFNHRGNVVTLIDIGQLLGISDPAAAENNKVIVAGLDGLLVGIRVADIFDVVYIDAARLSPVPAAMAGACADYLQGEFPYADRMLTVLDLGKILASSELLVEQKV